MAAFNPQPKYNCTPYTNPINPKPKSLIPPPACRVSGSACRKNVAAVKLSAFADSFALLEGFQGLGLRMLRVLGLRCEAWGLYWV